MFKGEAVRRVADRQGTPVNHEGVDKVAEKSPHDESNAPGLLIEFKTCSSKSPQADGLVEKISSSEVEVDSQGLEDRESRGFDSVAQANGPKDVLDGSLVRGWQRHEKTEDKDEQKTENNLGI